MDIKFPSEKEMEDYIWTRLSEDGVCPVSGRTANFYFRQKDIKGYGVTDIVKVRCRKNKIIITVLELKNEPLKEAHVAQLCRYMNGLNRIADYYRERRQRCPEIVIKGELAGPFEKNRNDLVWLVDHMPEITLYNVSISIDSGFCSLPIQKGWYRGDEEVESYRSEEEEITLYYQEYQEMISTFAEADGGEDEVV